METRLDEKQFDGYTRYQNSDYGFNDNQDYVGGTQNLENETPKEIPWKQLSLGGAFGLLIGGGSIIAANTMKSDDEEALLAGAEVGGDVEVVGEEPENETANETANAASQTEVSSTGNSHETANAANAATETANAATTPSSTTININVAPNHHNPNHHIHQDHPVQHIHEHVDVYHEVNVIDMDDSLSFAQAFAQARAELGPGGAFEWRGGVFGTYHANEWNSMSHAEQADFTATAMNTYANGMHDNYLAQTTVSHHFSEGDVIDLETGMAYHDEPYYIDRMDVETVVEAGDTADYDAMNNDIEIIDSLVDVHEGVQDLIEVNDAFGDFLNDVSNIIEDVSAAGQSLEDVAALINDTQDYSSGNSDFSYEIESTSDTQSDDIMPDYVSDGDTADIM